MRWRFVVAVLVGLSLWSARAEAVISVDTTTVARFNLSHTTGDDPTGTSAQFTAPASSLLVVAVACDTGVGVTPTLTVTNGGTPLTWSTRVERGFADGATDGYTAIARALNPNSQSTTVTATCNNTATAAGTRGSAKVYIVTGHHTSAPDGTTGEFSTTTQNSTTTVYTSSVANSRGFFSASDWNVSGTPTSADLEDGFTLTSLSGMSAIKSSDTASSGTAVTLNIASPNPGPAWNVVGYEVAPAVGGGDTEPPTAPGTPSATVVTSAQIDLAWTAASDNVAVSQYRLERCQGSGCVNFAEIVAQAGLTYSDTGLGAATLYRYRARAMDSSNNLGPYSSITEATTYATQSLRIQFVDQQADGISSETNFVINRKIGTGGTWTALTTVGPSAGTGLTVTYNDTSAPQPTACYQVAATNAFGASAYLGGDAGVCYTAPIQLPSAPTGLRIAYDRAPVLSWTDASNNENAFVIARRLTCGSGSFTDLTTVAADVVYYQDPSPPATQAEYRVRSRNASGDSSVSNEVCWVKERSVGVQFSGRAPTTPNPIGVRQR